MRKAQNKVDLIFRNGKFEIRPMTCDILGVWEIKGIKNYFELIKEN